MTTPAKMRMSHNVSPPGSSAYSLSALSSAAPAFDLIVGKIMLEAVVLVMMVVDAGVAVV